MQTTSDAVAWLAYTYLYVRMLKNPSLYGASEYADYQRIDPLGWTQQETAVDAACSDKEHCVGLRLVSQWAGHGHLQSYQEKDNRLAIQHVAINIRLAPNLAPNLADST